MIPDIIFISIDFSGVTHTNSIFHGCIKWIYYPNRQAVRRAGIKNFVEFFQGKGCYARLGMDGGDRGGRQLISLGKGCWNRGM